MIGSWWLKVSEPIEGFFGEHRWLSNFWPAQVQLGVAYYPTVEHAYQAAKTDVEAQRKQIQQARTAGDAKRLGRRVRVRPYWDRVKVDVMRGLIHQKFQHPDLKAKLVETGDSPLIEHNTWGDRFWGVCNGEGLNWLGKLIMEERERLRVS